ncbi:P-loop containing nucleoside triphosphate hydrolase protein, partial [Phyllosticta citriasiana]
PSDEELEAARTYFSVANRKFAFSCERFAEFPDSDVPEFAFIGRSNVGKSSLLNALLSRRSPGKQEEELAKVGKRAGLTRLMNIFLVGPIECRTKTIQCKKKKRTKTERRIERRHGHESGFTIVDMPGYGHGSLDFQGEEIMKYLSQRTQLQRTFVLINAEHGATKLDKQMFEILALAGTSYQIVFTKTDNVLTPASGPVSDDKARSGLSRLRWLRSQVLKIAQPPIKDVLCVSAERSLGDKGGSKNELIGMNGLRFAMLQAASVKLP